MADMLDSCAKAPTLPGTVKKGGRKPARKRKK